MSENPTVSIPKDVIEPIIEAQVCAAMTEALGGHEALVNKAVSVVLNTKVDGSGKPDKYGYDRSLTWLQWAVRDSVTKAAKQTIVDYLEKNQSVIRNAIKAQLTKKNSPLVRQLISGMVGSLTSPQALKYRIHISCDEKS